MEVFKYNPETNGIDVKPAALTRLVNRTCRQELQDAVNALLSQAPEGLDRSKLADKLNSKAKLLANGATELAYTKQGELRDHIRDNSKELFDKLTKSQAPNNSFATITDAVLKTIFN